MVSLAESTILNPLSSQYIVPILTVSFIERSPWDSHHRHARSLDFFSLFAGPAFSPPSKSNRRKESLSQPMFQLPKESRADIDFGLNKHIYLYIYSYALIIKTN